MNLIEVKNDWTWVREHAFKMINDDEQLENDVLAVARVERIEVIDIIDLYHEGLDLGIIDLHTEINVEEEGKYLSFKDWFYSFYGL